MHLLIPQSIQVRGYAYAAPCTLSLEAARQARGLVTSVVVGDDMVPRFCLGTVRELQRGVHIVLELGRDAAMRLSVELEHAQDHPPSPEALDLMIQLAQAHSERLYPPGQILHIRANMKRKAVNCAVFCLLF